MIFELRYPFLFLKNISKTYIFNSTECGGTASILLFQFNYSILFFSLFSAFFL